MLNTIFWEPLEIPRKPDEFIWLVELHTQKLLAKTKLYVILIDNCAGSAEFNFILYYNSCKVLNLAIRLGYSWDFEKF